MAAKKKAAARKRNGESRRPARNQTVRKAHAAVRTAGGDSHAVGRPKRPFDPKIGAEIASIITRNQLRVGPACDGVGISRDLCARWLEDHEEFALLIKKAEFELQRDLVRELSEGGAGLWQRAAWKLERMFPETFGQRAQMTLKATHKVEVSAQICQQLVASWAEFERHHVIDVDAG